MTLNLSTGWLLPLALAAALIGAEEPTAPDGRRGFGERLGIKEVQDLLNSDEESDRLFLSRLFAMKSELAIREINTRRLYERLGYFELLPRSTAPELEILHDAFFAELEVELAKLEEEGTFRPELARIWGDVSFVLRSELFFDARRDLADVERGMIFLLAHRDGYADVSDNEVVRVTARIDLAAARLRAALLDLDSLSQSEAWIKTATELSQELIELTSLIDDEKRMAEFYVLEGQLRDRLEQARSVLFTTRLALKIEAKTGARDWNLAEAETYLAELLPLMPGTDEARDAPAEIRNLAAQERHGRALQLAMAGLTYDPLSEDLNYYAGVSSEFLYGEIEALRWYDRYLAVRGLRAYLTSTTTGRVLTKKERRALDVVQRLERSPNRPK